MLYLSTSLPVFILIPLIKVIKDERLTAFILSSFTLIGLIGILVKIATIVFIVFLGIGIGGSFMLSLMLISIRSQNGHQTAVLSGMTQCVGYLLASIGPLIIGYIHQLTLNWTIALISCVFCSVIIIFLSVLAADSKKKIQVITGVTD